MSGVPKLPGRGGFDLLTAVEQSFSRNIRGRVKSASPALTLDTARPAPGGVRFGGTGLQEQTDTFDLAGGEQIVTLSKLPVPNGVPKVDMQGLGLHATDDYTLSGQTLTVLAAADARAGMKLEVAYYYLVDLPAPSGQGLNVPDTSIFRYKQGLGPGVGPAAVGYDDSAWPTGKGPFVAPATASFGNTKLAFPLDLWVRIRATSAGGPLVLSGSVDNSLKVYIDGALVATFSAANGGQYNQTVNGINSGAHVIAAYGSGDSQAQDVLDLNIVEQVQ